MGVDDEDGEFVPDLAVGHETLIVEWPDDERVLEGEVVRWVLDEVSYEVAPAGGDGPECLGGLGAVLCSVDLRCEKLGVGRLEQVAERFEGSGEIASRVAAWWKRGMAVSTAVASKAMSRGSFQCR